MASSTRGGVLANDETREGEGGKMGRSDSKFRNSVQSELKVGSPNPDCTRSSCGGSNRVDKSSAMEATATSVGGTRKHCQRHVYSSKPHQAHQIW